MFTAYNNNMKKITLLQLLLLLAIDLIGLYMKVTFQYQYKLLHEGLGIVVGVVSLGTVYLAFKQKLTSKVKVMAVLALGFIGVASIGGHLIEIFPVDWFTYGLMEGGGVLSLLTTLWMLKFI